jgi:E3 ubiquitin-protein ligase SHPRH
MFYRYFRQLQEISDSVAEVELDSPLRASIIEAEITQNNLNGKITNLRARQRYLDNLSRNQNGSEKVDEDEFCILCR